MDMNNSIQLTQKTTITPYLYQYFDVLQKCQNELGQYLEKQLSENPVLEAEPDDNDSENSYEELKKKLEWYEEDNETARLNYENGRNEDKYAFVSNQEDDLYQSLLLQLQMLKLSKTDYKTAEYIIYSLNHNGYLDIDISIISKKLKVTRGKVERILGLIQEMDPPGVGARNLKECLAIQLRMKCCNNPDLYVLIDNYLDDLSRKKFVLIAKKMGISLDELKSLYDAIKSLEPYPAANFNSNREVSYVIPDIFVTRTGNSFEVSLNNSLSPRLRINSYYKNILQDNHDEETVKYIKTKIFEAESIIKCISRRDDTLLKISKLILKIQMEFFERGNGNLVPMTLDTITAGLSMHKSTISRAIRNKHLQCVWGIFELKHFFPAHFDCELNNNSITSATNIKLMIKKLIVNEDKNKPFSDQKITELLIKENLNVSRRTIAKYREEMKIPPASQRKVL